jgi:hypothetical protein
MAATAIAVRSGGGSSGSSGSFRALQGGADLSREGEERIRPAQTHAPVAHAV